MKLRYVILYVDDVAASMSFFREAFGLSEGFLHESGVYGEMATGETRLAFSSTALMRSLGKEPARPDLRAPAFEIAFETTDVAAALAKAEAAGAQVLQPLRDEPWGQSTAYVADPNGYFIELCTPVRS